MRKGAIDQILMLMMVFVFLVTILFLVVDYASVGKMQNQLDMIARQGSRFVSLGRDTEKIAGMINTLKTNYFQNVSSDDIVCNRLEDEKAKVLFRVEGIFQSRFKLLGDNGKVAVSSTSVAYNEFDSDEINCSITLRREGKS